MANRIPAPRSPLVRAFLWAGAGFLVLVVIAGAVATIRLASVVDDLREARDVLDRAGTAVEEGRLADARAGLETANALLVSANNALYESPLDAIDWLPVVRENLSSLRESVGTALSISTGGRRLLEAARPLEAADGTLEVPLRQGAIPLAAVADAAIEAENLALTLPVRGEERDGALLVGAVADLRDRVRDEAVRRHDQLVNLANGLDLVTEMSGGNGFRRYLIAVANSAEMRGTGGMILSYGVLEGSDGDFELAQFGQIDELFLGNAVDAGAVGASADELTRWEGLEPTRLWRNANLIPDLAAVGPRLLAMYQAATGQPANGVIQIDAHGLAAILTGVGPVEVPELGVVDAGNVVALTLNEAYTLFPDRDQRQEVLGDVAEAVFERLTQGDYPSLRPLGESLLMAAAQRHVQFWSPSARVLATSAFFNASGAVPRPDVQDYALLSVQNFAGNKLDYYIDTGLRLTGTRPPGEFGSITAEITVANAAPAGGESSYVFGPNIEGVGAGEYRTIVSLYLPIGTNLEGFSGATFGEVPVIGSEGGRTFVAYAVTLPAGATSTVTLQLTVPPRPEGPYSLTLVPVPRVRPTNVSLQIDAGDGTINGQFPLTQPAVLTTTERGDTAT